MKTLIFLLLKHILGLKKVLFFVSFCSTVLHCKITVKNKADYFVDFTYHGLFLEHIPRDKRGFTVLLIIEVLRHFIAESQKCGSDTTCFETED